MHTNYRALFEPLITDEDRKKELIKQIFDKEENDLRNLKILIGIVTILFFVVV